MVMYRIALTVLAPIFVLLALWRLATRSSSLADIQERLGSSTGQPGVIWVHGASVGELTSAKALIEALMMRFADQPILITTNTTTGRDTVNSWGLGGLDCRLAPLDLRWVLRRFRARFQPTVLISLENEMWPNRIAASPIPVFCIAARLSKRSTARWGRWDKIIGPMLTKITYLAPQDARSGERFLDLGLLPNRLGPVVALKPGVTPKTPRAAVLAEFTPIFKRSTTVLAAATHDGEDATLLDGVKIAQSDNPDIKLLLAPRHPHRATAIRALALARGMNVTTRSKGETPTAETDIYLVDTLGEMPIWYALAAITFVGGSLVPKGGHTPFEPAAAGSMIVHGPHTENFDPAYEALRKFDGASLIKTANDFAQILAMPSDQQTEIISNATTCLAQLKSDPAMLDQLIDQIENRLK